jgi:hypothetical protein
MGNTLTHSYDCGITPTLTSTLPLWASKRGCQEIKEEGKEEGKEKQGEVCVDVKVEEELKSTVVFVEMHCSESFQALHYRIGIGSLISNDIGLFFILLLFILHFTINTTQLTSHREQYHNSTHIIIPTQHNIPCRMGTKYKTHRREYTNNNNKFIWCYYSTS